MHCYFLVRVSILNVCPSVSWRPRTSSACGPCWTWPTAMEPCWAHPGSWYLLHCRYTHTQTCHKCLHLVCGYFFSAIHHQQHSLSVRPLLQIVVPHFHLPSNFSCCSTWSGFWGWSQGWAEPLSLAELQRDPAQWVCPHFLTLGTSGFWSCSGWLNFLLQLLPFNQVLTTAVMTDLPVIANILSRLFESSQSVNTNNRLKAYWAKTYYLSSHLFTLLSMITLT